MQGGLSGCSKGIFFKDCGKIHIAQNLPSEPFFSVQSVALVHSYIQTSPLFVPEHFQHAKGTPFFISCHFSSPFPCHCLATANLLSISMDLLTQDSV